MTPEGRAPVSVKLIGVSPLAVTEKVPALFSAKVVEVARGEHRRRGGHREGEGLGRGVGVGVGGGDGDRVAAGRAEGRACPTGCRWSPGVTPEGRAPVSVKVIGVSPVAVTEKVPALFSANVVEPSEVNTGAKAEHKAAGSVAPFGVPRPDAMSYPTNAG